MGNEQLSDSKHCAECGEKFSGVFGSVELMRSTRIEKICFGCEKKAFNERDKIEKKERIEAQEAAQEAAKALAMKAKNLPVTTGNHTVAGQIEREIDIITAECVLGMSVLTDLFSVARDLVGGRAKSFEQALLDARRTCMQELREEAVRVGADAIIGVDLDYSEISGGGKSMLFVVASGTAVKLIQQAEEENK